MQKDFKLDVVTDIGLVSTPLGPYIHIWFDDSDDTLYGRKNDGTVVPIGGTGASGTVKAELISAVDMASWDGSDTGIPISGPITLESNAVLLGAAAKLIALDCPADTDGNFEIVLNSPETAKVSNRVTYAFGVINMIAGSPISTAGYIMMWNNSAIGSTAAGDNTTTGRQFSVIFRNPDATGNLFNAGFIGLYLIWARSTN